MPQSSLSESFGAAFIGLIATAVMYGLTLLQTYYYFKQYPKDSWRLKFLVFVLWLLDTAHLFLCSAAIYWYLIANFGNAHVLEIPHWTINLQTDCNTLVGIIVELFFALRVWRISRNWILTGVIVVLACLYFGLGVFFTARAFIINDFAKYSELTWVTVLGLSSAAAADIIIASSLCYFLRKSRTGFPRTDSLITSLILYAINTGLLTSICATAAVISFATMPTNFIWISFFWVLGKFYVNSLLATLNSREYLRDKVLPSDGTIVHLSPLRTDNGVGDAHSTWGGYRYQNEARRTMQPVNVTVVTTKEQRTDDSATPDGCVDDAPEPLSTKSATAHPPADGTHIITFTPACPPWQS